MSDTSKNHGVIISLLSCLKMLEQSNDFTSHEVLMKHAQTKIKELHSQSKSDEFDQVRKYAMDLVEISRNYRKHKNMNMNDEHPDFNAQESISNIISSLEVVSRQLNELL